MMKEPRRRQRVTLREMTDVRKWGEMGEMEEMREMGEMEEKRK